MKLIFVYNADSGMLNTVKDIGHKLFSPQTYDCFLCSLTHGTFTENPQWKSYREKKHTVDMEFLHRDEFEKLHGQHFEYPVILRESEKLEIAVSKDQLASFTSLEDLIDTVESLTEPD